MNKIWIRDLIFNKNFNNNLTDDYRPVIFEVGAADATDSHDFIQSFDKIDLYTFEPDPRNLVTLNLLKEKVEEHFVNGERRIFVYEGVVGDVDGSIVFNMADGDGSTDDYGKNFRAHSGSIKKPKLHLEMHPSILFNNTMDTDSTTLDTFCEKNSISIIDFLWADVQGAEDLMIIGGKETFANRVRFFYTEYYNNEVYENQPSLPKIKEMLGENWALLQDFGHDALFFNTKLK